MSTTSTLRKLFESHPSIIRLVGAHNGLGATLIERRGFEGIWAGGLEVSTAHAVPDASILTMTEFLEAATAINDATQLPVICDCDTGYGNAANVIHMVTKYEAAGLAAVTIEDKHFPKLNSFVQGRQELLPIDEFARKIEAAKSAQQHDAFMVFARTEAFIAGWGLEEALRRAHAYADAGADGIVVHSKSSQPDEIFAFAKCWDRAVPLIAIPSTYPAVTGEELATAGFRMAIYANHGIRATIRALEQTLHTIAAADTTLPVEANIASLQEVFEIQGMGQLKAQEAQFVTAEQNKVQAIIPAAADHRSQPELQDLLKNQPLCMLDIGGMPLLHRQMQLLRRAGVGDIYVIGGYRHNDIAVESATVLVNTGYANSRSPQSIMTAREHFRAPTLIMYSDILFDQEILDQLLQSPHELTLVIDRAFRSLPQRDKLLELVVTEQADDLPTRRIALHARKPIQCIGEHIPPETATHEFIGMALFREAGLRWLEAAWDASQHASADQPFQEAIQPGLADFTDLVQHVIDSGHPVHGLEIEHGWSEIHSLDDYQRVCQHVSMTLAEAGAPSVAASR